MFKLMVDFGLFNVFLYIKNAKDFLLRFNLKLPMFTQDLKSVLKLGKSNNVTFYLYNVFKCDFIFKNSLLLENKMSKKMIF